MNGIGSTPKYFTTNAIEKINTQKGTGKIRHTIEFRPHVVHPWAPEIASWLLHVGFVLDEMEFGPVFLGGSSVSRCQNFHSTNFSILTSSIH